MFVSQSPTSVNIIHPRLIHAVRHAVFSRETNVTRPGLTPHFGEIARCSFELSLDQTRNLHCTLCRSAYLEVFIAPGDVQSPLHPIVRIVRRNEIACAVIAFRCALSSALRNVWSSMRYHSQEAKRSRKLRSRLDPGKLMRPEISHSAVLTTHLSAECARYPRVLYTLNCLEIAHMHQRVCPCQCRTTVLLVQLNLYILAF